MRVGGACGDVLSSCDAMRCARDGVLIGDVGELPIHVIVLHAQKEVSYSHGLVTSYWK